MATEMKSDPKGLRGKVVLITGASSGVGKDCALSFAEEGSFLAITGRKKDELLEVKESCLSLGLADDKVLAIVAELDKESEVERLVKETVDHFEKIDVLVNNAALVLPGTMETSKMEDFDCLININLRVPFLLTKLCLSYLIETKGSVVNVSSISSQSEVNPDIIIYSFTKSALDQMTRCLSLEVAGRGVRVNSVNPGHIKTDFVLKNTGINKEQHAKILEDYAKIYPMGRIGKPEEMANGVVFLASSQASFITGTILTIDGGYSLMCPR